MSEYTRKRYKLIISDAWRFSKILRDPGKKTSKSNCCLRSEIFFNFLKVCLPKGYHSMTKPWKCNLQILSVLSRSLCPHTDLFRLFRRTATTDTRTERYRIDLLICPESERLHIRFIGEAISMLNLLTSDYNFMHSNDWWDHIHNDWSNQFSHRTIFSMYVFFMADHDPYFWFFSEMNECLALSIGVFGVTINEMSIGVY